MPGHRNAPRFWSCGSGEQPAECRRVEERDLEAQAPGVQVGQRRIRESRTEQCYCETICAERSERCGRRGGGNDCICRATIAARQFTTVLGNDRLSTSGRTHAGDAKLDTELFVQLRTTGGSIGRAAIARSRGTCACKGRHAGPEETDPHHQHCKEATHAGANFRPAHL